MELIGGVIVLLFILVALVHVIEDDRPRVIPASHIVTPVTAAQRWERI